MSTSAPLLVEQRGQVRWLRLNRPDRRNALDSELISALDKQITGAEVALSPVVSEATAVRV